MKNFWVPTTTAAVPTLAGSVAPHFVNNTSKIDLILNPLPYSTLI
jgi:hypothetical protein